MRVKFNPHKGSRLCLDSRTQCTSSSICTRARALVSTPAFGASQFKSHKGLGSCLDSRTRCESSLIHTRAHALGLTPALTACQVRLAQGLGLLSQLPNSVRVKFDSHKGPRHCLGPHCLSARQVRFAQGLTLLSRLPHLVRVKFDLRKGTLALVLTCALGCTVRVK